MAHRQVFLLLFLAVVALVIIGGTGGCSDSNDECQVTYNADEGRFFISVKPPGESGSFTTDGITKETREITDDKDGRTVKMKYEINEEWIFKESGEVYEMVATVQLHTKDKKTKLTGYTLSVTGGVYGETPHICTK